VGDLLLDHQIDKETMGGLVKHNTTLVVKLEEVGQAIIAQHHPSLLSF